MNSSERKPSPSSPTTGKSSPVATGLIPVGLPDLAQRTFSYLSKRDGVWVKKSLLYSMAKSHGYSDQEVRQAFADLEDLGRLRGYKFVNFCRNWTREEGTTYCVHVAPEEELVKRREGFIWFDSLR